MDGSDVLLREAELERRRSRVLRGIAALVGGFVLGIAVLAAVREGAPGAFDGFAALFALSLLGGMLALWWTGRRLWRCPACEVRWRLSEALAAAHWNHCSSCGEALRASAARGPQAEGPTDLPEPGADTIAGFARRRRIAGVAMVLISVGGIAALSWMSDAGQPKMARDAVIGLLAGAIAVAALVGSRCPRCEKGVLGGRDAHCPRCGYSLPPPDPRPAQ